MAINRRNEPGEKALESRLFKRVKKAGGIALKLQHGVDGMPDRVLFLPGGRAVLCEVKTPGEEPTKLQQARLRKFSRLGFKTFVLDSESQYINMVTELNL